MAYIFNKSYPTEINLETDHLQFSVDRSRHFSYHPAHE